MLIELSRLTTQEVEQAAARIDVAILPIGATEQHGPHLELRTDIAIAEALSRRVADAYEGGALLLPPFAVGCSEHHLAFAGTLSLRPSTLLAVLADILASVKLLGITRVLILNGHGGNTDIARIAAREARSELGMQVAHIMWGQLLIDRTSEVFEPGLRYHHACEVETSIAAACDSGLLRPDQLRKPPGQAPLDGWTDAPRPMVDLPAPFDELSPSGTLGDPTRMDAAWGGELVETFVERTVSFLESFARPVADEVGVR